MAAMTKEPVVTAPIMVWRYCQMSHGFRRRLQKLVRASVPSAWTSYPTGCCMKALVATMKNPEIQDPAKTAKADTQCILGLSFLWPKRKRPRKEDSRKKAKVPSMARVWPMTPPVASQNRAQLVPNWNSMGMPVTTPMAKANPKIFPQNRADRSYRGSPVRKRQGFEDDDEETHPHGELGEDVVIGDGEGEVKSVEKEGWIHGGLPLVEGAGSLALKVGN